MNERKRAKPKRASASPKAGATAAADRDLASEILEICLYLAEETRWDALRLRQVAARLEIPLGEVLHHYRDLDAVADAWFRRAWEAMLAPPPDGFAALPAPERIYQVTMRWFDALVGHRAVTGQMLRTKLYPSHPHHWVPMVFNLSRTIHWLREAAFLDAGGRQRQLEEIGLTAIFLATLNDWLRDETPGQERTRAALRRRLNRADRVMARACAVAKASPGVRPSGAARSA